MDVEATCASSLCVNYNYGPDRINARNLDVGPYLVKKKKKKTLI